jgi:hypothetical protein
LQRKAGFKMRINEEEASSKWMDFETPSRVVGIVYP